MLKPKSIESSLIKPDGLPEVTEYMRHHKICAYFGIDLNDEGRQTEIIQFVDLNDPEKELPVIVVSLDGGRIRNPKGIHSELGEFRYNVALPVLKALAEVQPTGESIAGHEKFQGFFESE